MVASSESRIYLVGPTASGKTELAIELAERFSGEIVSADSVQFYQGLDIGAAKPSATQLARVPHHMIDCRELGGAPLTVGDYQRMVTNLIAERHACGVKNFWIVGGSGFYVAALQKGLFPSGKVAPEVREQLQKDLEQEGLPSLYARLEKLDSAYAATISPNDSYRVVRALEIWVQHGRSPLEIRAEHEAKEPLAVCSVKCGLHCTRDELMVRIRARTAQMLRQGLIEETEHLLKLGLGSWPPLGSVGYKQVVLMLEGALGRHEVEEKINIATWQLAKKQLTWFRRDKDIRWFELKQKAELEKALAATLS